MSRFDANWRRLVASARRAPAQDDPGSGVAPLDHERVRALVAAALAAPRGGSVEWRWEPRSVSAAAALAAALAFAVWRSDVPLAGTVYAVADELAALPRQLPRAPRLPRFDLPSPAALLDALPDLRSWPAASGPASTSPPPSAPEHSP